VSQSRDMKRTSLENALCPVARSLDEIGDWWTLLIVRDAFHGVKRFSDFQNNLGLAKNILSARLRTLVSNGILEKRPSASASGRSDYHLTEKGRRLRVVLVALRQWGEDNLFTEGEPMLVMHDSANRPISRLRLMTQEGRPLEPEELVVTRGRKKKRARGPRQAPAVAGEVMRMRFDQLTDTTWPRCPRRKVFSPPASHHIQCM
jgi:DNA-binding HxlR family transcriptional regulator